MHKHVGPTSLQREKQMGMPEDPSKGYGAERL